MRHPRNCKYWIEATEGCRRGDECSYLHDRRKYSKVDKADERISDENKATSLKENEKNAKDLRIVELENVVNQKDDTINDLKEKKVNLKDENENFKSQVERLNGVAASIHKELKLTQKTERERDI